MGHLYPDPGFIMSDEDGDGIWSYTMDLEPGVIHINLEMVGGQIGILEVDGKIFRPRLCYGANGVIEK